MPTESKWATKHWLVAESGFLFTIIYFMSNFWAAVDMEEFNFPDNYPPNFLFLRLVFTYQYRMLPRWLHAKESSCQCRRCRKYGFHPWVRKIFWRRKWQPTPVFLPGESTWTEQHGGYSPQGHKESDMTEHTNIANQCAFIYKTIN